jgi:hypothetical protein
VLCVKYQRYNSYKTNFSFSARCYNLYSLFLSSAEVAQAASCCSGSSRKAHSPNCIYLHNRSIYRLFCQEGDRRRGVVQHHERLYMFKRTALLSLLCSLSLSPCYYADISCSPSVSVSIHIFLIFGCCCCWSFRRRAKVEGGGDNHFNRVGLFKTKIIKRGKKKRIWFDWNLHKDVMLYSRLILNLYTDNHFLLILLLLCRRQGESIWLLTQLVCWLFALLPTIALGGAGWSPIYLKFTRDYLKFTETFFFALMMGIDRHFLSFLKISVDKSKGHTKNEKWPINAR